MNKEKICKGKEKAKGYGCGKPTLKHTYGLCYENGCYPSWLFNAPEASKKRDTFLSNNKSKVKKINKSKKNITYNFNIYKTAAWYWCTKFVLLYYADEYNEVQCSTSPHLIYNVTDKNIHTGHFIKVKDGSKSNHSVAFDFRNLAPQSYVDNVRLGGKPEVMKEWLISKHGEKEIEKLIIKSKETCKLTKFDLDEIAKNYRLLFNNLLIERNIKNPWK